MTAQENAPQKLLTGRQALQAAGMQPEFAKVILQSSQHFNTGISFRAGNPPDYNSKRAPKSGVNLSKTSNHGLGASLIAADPLFTKLDGKRNPIGHDEKDKTKLDANKQLTTQLFRSFRDVINRTQLPNGDMEFCGYDKQNNVVKLKYRTGKGPIHFKGEICIPLAKGEKIERYYSRPWDKPKTNPALPYGLPPRLLDMEFPIEFVREKGREPEPFKVFATNVAKEGEGPDIRPITGDWDILAIGHPPKIEDFDGRERVVYNTFKSVVEKDALIAETRELFNLLKSKAIDKMNPTLLEKIGIKEPKKANVFEAALQKYDFKDIYDEYAFDRAGCITPYEFLQARILNLSFEDPNIKNLIQHGAENRNPYKPSDLDGNILHFYQGNVTLTRNEEELIKFYLTNDYLKNNHIEVHPGWPMEKWDKVIEKQKELGMDIPEKTLKSYQDFQKVVEASKALQQFHLLADNIIEANYQSIKHAVKNNQKLPDNILQALKSYESKQPFLETPETSKGSLALNLAHQAGKILAEKIIQTDTILVKAQQSADHAVADKTKEIVKQKPGS